MARYDRHYDYGMRGFRDGPPSRFRANPRSAAGFDPMMDERSRPRIQNRVTERYNLDYVYGARGRRYDRNYSMYTGDRSDRMGDERLYRQPYYTIGGTRTLRGSGYPTGYDRPEYGPNFGGRYPDEMY